MKMEEIFLPFEEKVLLFRNYRFIKAFSTTKIYLLKKNCNKKWSRYVILIEGE